MNEALIERMKAAIIASDTPAQIRTPEQVELINAAREWLQGQRPFHWHKRQPKPDKRQRTLTARAAAVLELWTETERKLEALAASGEQSREQRQLAMLYDQCSHFYWGLPYTGPEPELLENELAQMEGQRTRA